MKFLLHILEKSKQLNMSSLPTQIMSFIFFCILYHRKKNELLDTVQESLRRRFQDVETDEVLKAASNLVDPREWPSDKQDWAHYGSDLLHTVTGHFAEVLDRSGCDRYKAKHDEWPAAKVLIKSLPPSEQTRACKELLDL